MLHKKLLLAALISSTITLVACGSDDGDDVTINVTESPATSVTTPSPAPTPAPAESMPANMSCEDLNAKAFVVDSTDDCSRVTLKNSITESITLTKGTIWVLDEAVKVGAGDVNISSNEQAQAIKDAGVTLTIEPGTNVQGFNSGLLVITRGSKLIADGLKEDGSIDPITFSSFQDSNLEGEGEWGGIIVQGFASQYRKGNGGHCNNGVEGQVYCNIKGEGGDKVGNYGGTSDDDDSGIIRYVRIAEGGTAVGVDNEVNGLTLQGVGYKTIVDYVQVHGNLDDGVEWFGGTVNATHLVLTNNDDDDIDYDEGYKGNIQYAIIRKHPTKEAPTGSNDPRGIEANSSNAEYVPQTNAALANITILGSQLNNNENSDEGQQPGMRLRGALTTSIYNSVVDNFTKGCIRIDNAKIENQADVPSQVTLTNVIGAQCDEFFSHENPVANTGETGIKDLTVDTAYALNTDVGTLETAATFVPVNNGSEFTFDTDGQAFIGAVAPGTQPADAWWAGWTLEGTLD